MNPTAALDSIGTAAGRLGDLDGRFLALALALQLGNLLLRSLAWRNVVAAAYPDRRVPLLGVAASYAAGVAANSFLPARGGEAVKVALLRTQVERSAVATLAAAGSVVLLLDSALAGVLLGCAWLLGAVPALPAPPGLADHAGMKVIAAVVLVAAGVLLGRRLLVRAPQRVRKVVAQLRQGAAILGDPGRYVRTVATLQLAAWGCRIGVAFALLSAFGLPATLQLAALVVVVGGMSTLVPATPGGMGTQQVMIVYLLHETVSTAHALAFSIGMQATITAVNTMIGLAAIMVVFRTMRPAAAVRAVARTARR
jgi:uncharacterized membrane protein YbhN (UPF0104 family)